jgi:hypothetical protein
MSDEMKSIGNLALQLTPFDRQHGQRALVRPVTQAQWESIMAGLGVSVDTQLWRQEWYFTNGAGGYSGGNGSAGSSGGVSCNKHRLGTCACACGVGQCRYEGGRSGGVA